MVFGKIEVSVSSLSPTVLGNIVVSAPRDGKSGVFQYDFGKTIQDKAFQNTRFLNQPPTVLRTALNGLRAQYKESGHQIEHAISKVLEKKAKTSFKVQSAAPRL
jgi:hypothetical protein